MENILSPNQPHIPSDKPILLFDGVCNLCNGAVQFIIKRDKKAKFRFAALQSETGHQLLSDFQLSDEYLSTLVLVENGKVYLRSDAVLRIAKSLGGFWSLAYGFIIIPRFIRDAAYDWVGRHRYQWFGKEESCMMPTPELKSRFLN
jgi:predicted DCC family thiol-disulfide oxidoreductase YuxK